jgi:hypothetical protein
MTLLWELVDQAYEVGWRWAGRPCRILRLGRDNGVVRAVAVEVDGDEIVQIGDFKGAFQNDRLQKGVGVA